MQQLEGSPTITNEEVNSRQATNAKMVETQSKVVGLVGCMKNKEKKALVEIRLGAALSFPSTVTIHLGSDQIEAKIHNNSRNEHSRNLHKATTPRHAMVSATSFRWLTKGNYLELFGMKKNEELGEGVISMEYQDIQGGFL